MELWTIKIYLYIVLRNADGEETYSVIATQSTQHIAAMKRCERTKNARRSRPRYSVSWVLVYLTASII